MTVEAPAENFGQRMKRIQAEKAAQASAPNPATTRPKVPTRTMSELDHFEADRIARPEPELEESEVAVPSGMDGIAEARVAVTVKPLVRMYKPSPYGHIPVNIPEANVAMCYTVGKYLSRCPDCKTADCGDDRHSQCAGRAPRAYRICPVMSCQKDFLDEPALGAPVGDATDPNLIQDDSYATSTPETRTRAALDSHMIYYHPQETLSLAPHLQPLVIAHMTARAKG